MKKFLYLGAMLLMFVGCSVENPEDAILDSYDAKGNSAKNNNDNGPTTIGSPILNCGEVSADSWIIEVSAGAHGTPGGIKMEWMNAEDYEAAGNEFNDLACSEKFDSSKYELTEGGEPASIDLAQFVSSLDDSCFKQWKCEELYVFRVRAENPQGNEYKASGWSETVFCETQACEEICLYGFGYWRNHGPDSPGNQENAWPVNELMIGDKLMDEDQLLAILNLEVKGDAVLSLEQHLISTKFNLLIGGDDTEIAEMVNLADEMIMDPTTYTKEEINSVKDELEAYNESSDCEEED